HRGEVDFASHLARLGREHDCFFTLEEAWKEGERQDAISSHRIMGAAKGMEGAEPSAKGLDAEISRLQKEMPSLIFLRSSDRPCVVHVIDPRLRSLPNYPLDKVLKHVEHNGPIVGLLTVIASQGISVSAPKESGESATLRM